QQPPGDPYGQQPPGGGYPGSGGFGQQPQQPGFPQSGGFGQQQPGGGYGQQPGAYPTGQFGGGFGGPTPPKKSPLPWIITGVGVVVVLLVVLGGGFLWPGWFKGADTSDPKSVAQQLATVINNKDQDGAKKLDCNQSSNAPDEDFKQLGNATVNATLNGDPQVSGSSATAKYNLSVHGTIQGQNINKDNIPFEAKLKNQNGNWCVDSFGPANDSSGGAGNSGSSDSEQPSSGGYGGDTGGDGYGGDSSAPSEGSGSGGGSGGGGGSGDVQQTLQDLADAINSGDSSSASSALCSDAPSSTKQQVDQAIQQHAHVSLDGSPAIEGSGAAGNAQVTINGEQKEYTIGLINTSGSWCVEDIEGG
ncbi:MAG: hypothetical protein J2O49_10055, partial [Sciscionella sp.]|nr:hypothetical protein [Sciscionella sp.]